MNTWEIIATCIACGVVGLVFGSLINERGHRARASAPYRRMSQVFRPTPLACLTVAERQFPARIRADLQRALDDYFTQATSVLYVSGIQTENDRFGIELANLLTVGVSAWEVPLQNEVLSNCNCTGGS